MSEKARFIPRLQTASLLGISYALTRPGLPWGGPVAGFDMSILHKKRCSGTDAEEAERYIGFIAGTGTKYSILDIFGDECTQEEIASAIRCANQKICQFTKFLDQLKQRFPIA